MRHGLAATRLWRCVAALALGGPAHADGPTVALVQRHSTWEEHDIAGSRLLVERGNLRGLRLGWQWAWGADRLFLAGEGLHGGRAYDGRTSAGQAASTDVRVRTASWAVDLTHPLAATWQAHVGLGQTRLARDLQSTAAAAGYPERWRWTEARLGVEGRHAWGHAVVTSVTLEAGALVRARNRVALGGYDPVTLSPSQGRLWRAGLALEGRLDEPLASTTTHWRWQLAGDVMQRTFDASPGAALLRGGVLQGGLHQPRTRLRDASLSLVLRTDWP